MSHLYLVVEGRTEQVFVTDVLAPHLADRGIWVYPRLIGRPGHKGGNLNYDRVQRDIGLLLRQIKAHEARFSTMFDLYRLATNFPGHPTGITDPVSRVSALEDAFEADIDDPRFFPYLQLHEFEALLFTDVEPLGEHYGDPSAAKALAADTAGIEPERIDDGPETSPARRITRRFPRYARDKATVGPLCAHDIGLDRLRAACPHFAAWLTRLEALDG